MKKVLLHACCAPCATQVNIELRKEGLATTGFFYNPNIFPESEYEMRKRCMEYYSAIAGLETVYIENDLEHQAGNCFVCYEVRMMRAAQYAKANGFDAFTTTLLVSPYQKHDMIKKIGEAAAKTIGIEFVYRDFRKVYYEGRALSHRYNLYRQKYCGCEKSLEARGVKNEQTA